MDRRAAPGPAVMPGRRPTATAAPTPLLLAPLLLGTVVACVSDPREPLDIGDSVPALGPALSGPALIWVFRQESCLGCGLGPDAARLALLGHQHGDRIEIVAIAVGGDTNQDRSLVENFLRQRRLRTTVVLASPQRHARMFGAAPLPSLYLAHQGRVLLVLGPEDGNSADDRTADIGRRLDELLVASTLGSGTGEPTARPPGGATRHAGGQAPQHAATGLRR